MNKKIEVATTPLKAVVLRGQSLEIGTLGYKITGSMMQTSRVELVASSSSTITFDAELQVVKFTDGFKEVYVPASGVVQMEVI